MQALLLRGGVTDDYKKTDDPSPPFKFTGLSNCGGASFLSPSLMSWSALLCRGVKSMWSSLLSYHFSILSSEEVKFSAAYDDNATQDHVKCNVVYMSYRYIFQHLMLPTNPPLTITHDVWYPKQKRLNNEAPVPNPHPPPQHPRPTSQHCRQIPGPIRFHGERKRRRRQRNEVRKKVRSQGRVWWALEASKGADWYLQPDILLIGAGGITLKTSLKIYALSSAITLKSLIRKGYLLG
ncbi:hypothetical protein Bca101_083385 [Brassica carinata]